MLRVVSLIASATEIVHALGLGDYQVGRSHECDFPPRVAGLPVCTRPAFSIEGSSAEINRHVTERLRSALSLYDVDEQILDDLRPTHIVTQTQCKVCAVSLEDVERALAASISSRPRIVPLEPNSLADIWRDIEMVAEACGVVSEGNALVNSLRCRIAEISTRATRIRHRPRVACIEWHEPLMASGNWVPELIELANAENLFGKPGAHSPWLAWEDLTAADPDIIISMPCGFDLARTRKEMYWLAENSTWSGLRAVCERQVFLVDGNQYMNRPGPRVAESLRILAEILHPAAFEPTLEGVGWEHWV
jgi:iron complex transport system substrate-binding protein